MCGSHLLFSNSPKIRNAEFPENSMNQAYLLAQNIKINSNDKLRIFFFNTNLES